MSLLDSFVFALRLDAAKARRDLQGAGEDFENMGDEAQASQAKASGALKKLTFDSDKAAAHISDRFGGVFREAFGGITAGVTGIIAAAGSIDAVFDQLGEKLATVQDAATVGVDVSQYDALSKSFVQAGSDADGFRDSMIDLNESIGEATSDLKSGKAQAFKALGVSLKDVTGRTKTADEVLLNLSDTLSKMNKQQATFQIKQLGITDNKVIANLLNGRKELERQIAAQKESGVLTRQNADDLLKYQTAQRELNTILSNFAGNIALAIVPALTTLSKAIQDLFGWMSEHKGFLVGFFGAITTVALPALIKLAGAATAALIPFLPIIVAVTALGLAVDDLWTYFSGGESVIGDLAKRFPELEQFLADSKREVLEFIGALKTIATDPKKAISEYAEFLRQQWAAIIADAQKFIDSFIDKIVAGFNKLPDRVKVIILDMISWIKDALSNLGGMIGDSVSNAASKAWDNRPAWLGGSGEEDTSPHMASGTARAIEQGNQLAGDMAAIGAGVPDQGATRAMMASRSSSNVTTVTTGDINVTSTQASPEQVAAAVPGAIKDHYKSTAAAVDDGRSH